MRVFGLHVVLALLLITDLALSSRASHAKISAATSERVRRESPMYYDELPLIYNTNEDYDGPEEIYIPPEGPAEVETVAPEGPAEVETVAPEVNQAAGVCNSGSIPEIENTNYLVIDMQEGEELIPFCEWGFKGQGKAICRGNGEIELIDDFRCVRIVCPAPNEIANTEPFGDGPFYYGEIIRYKCLPGYFPSGIEPYTFCDEDGVFSFEEESRIVCSPPVFQKYHVTSYCDGLCERGHQNYSTICTNPYASYGEGPSYVDSACFTDEITETPVYSEECTHNVLPECPDKNEPLWNVVTPDDTPWYQQPSDCVYESNGALLKDQPSDRFPERVLQAKHYLKCDGIAEAIDEAEEFTISFIVKKTAGYWSYYDNNIIAYGKQGARLPILTFGTRRRNTKQLQLTAYLNGKRYRAFRIHPYLFWNRYAHFMISLGRNSLKVYVNGRRQGVSYLQTYNSRSYTESSGDSYFYMGRVGTLDYQPRTSGKAQQGDFSGSFSSLLVWNRAFTADEAQQTYMFYKQLIDEGNNAATPSVNLGSHMQKLFKPRRDRHWCMSEQKTFMDFVRENCFPVYD